jgi:hypothetical protein
MTRVRGHTAATGSLSSRAGQRCHQLMAAPIPMGLCQARGIGQSLATAGSIVWANKCSYNEKRWAGPWP